MKRLISTAKILSLLIVLLPVSGCMQYPEGPFFTLLTRDERLEGTWAIVSVKDAAGSDITAQFAEFTLTVEVNRSGDKIWSTYKAGNLNSFGTYQFADFGDELIIIYTTIDGNEAFAQVFYTIRQLTDKRLEYIDDKDFNFEWEKY